MRYNMSSLLVLLLCCRNVISLCSILVVPLVGVRLVVWPFNTFSSTNVVVLLVLVHGARTVYFILHLIVDGGGYVKTCKCVYLRNAYGKLLKFSMLYLVRN